MAIVSYYFTTHVYIIFVLYIFILYRPGRDLQCILAFDTLSPTRRNNFSSFQIKNKNDKVKKNKQ